MTVQCVYLIICLRITPSGVTKALYQKEWNPNEGMLACEYFIAYLWMKIDIIPIAERVPISSSICLAVHKSSTNAFTKEGEIFTGSLCPCVDSF